MNRLGDAFFMWSRWINNLLNVNEDLWDTAQSHQLVK
jgi:hypothetical protein